MALVRAVTASRSRPATSISSMPTGNAAARHPFEMSRPGIDMKRSSDA